MAAPIVSLSPIGAANNADFGHFPKRENTGKIENYWFPPSTNRQGGFGQIGLLGPSKDGAEAYMAQDNRSAARARRIAFFMGDSPWICGPHAASA